MDNQVYNQIVSFIWGIADDCLRDVFVRGQYRDVILPMVVLRRFDALLELTKDKVDEEIRTQRELGLDDSSFDDAELKQVAGVDFYNTSKWTLNRLKSNATDDNMLLYNNFVEYLNGYSDNVKDVFKNFDYYKKAERLATNDRLLAVIEKITDPHINLTDREMTDPEGISLPALSNLAMGTIFEELLRKFNEENNEETGAHFTPRDAIALLARLIFEPVKDNLPKTISLYDPAAGSGGMLTEGRDYLMQLGVGSSAIQLSGTEINPETYAICKADLIIKGVSPEGMHLGNTITDDHFPGKTFGYMITNPPYGKSWKTDKDRIYASKTLLDMRFQLRLANFKGEMEVVDCTPRTSDGQMLFMLEEVNKMKKLEHQPQGSRIATIHNGSSLFTGDAGQGESNIRRYLVENDLVDAIVQLPNNIFYNTGIATYVWLLTNKKDDTRKGKVQLIDASQAFDKLRKNQGSRNCTITPMHAEMIVQTYIHMHVRDADDTCPITSKVFRNDDFRYYSVTIERPLRLRSQFSAIKVDTLLYDCKEPELSLYLHQTYGDLVFRGLDDKLQEIKEYLQEQDIKIPDKKLQSLIDKKKWNDRKVLMAGAQTLMHQVGTELFMDYNQFAKTVETAAKKLKLRLTSAQIKSICRAMSETDPNAAPVIRKSLKASAREIVELTSDFTIDKALLPDYGIYPDGRSFIQYEPDTALRDSEKIPVSEDIYQYFKREVRPYVDDAWIELPETQIGCEISFNKYFYKPAKLRTLTENQADILALDRQSQGFIASLFGEDDTDDARHL